MSRAIKFRQFHPGWSVNGTELPPSFHYWGYISKDYPDTCTMPILSTRAEPSQQFTGLTDKNGKEIYEGDIVKDHYMKNHVSTHQVVWSDSFACWSTINVKEQLAIVDRKFLGMLYEQRDCHRNEVCEVIGNIYENPELLGGK